MGEFSNSAVSSLESTGDVAGSTVLVIQDHSVRDDALKHSDEAHASGETQETLGETGAVSGTSLLVACGELESGEQEIKNKMENLRESINEQSVVKGVSGADLPGKKLLVLDVNGLLVDIVSPVPEGFNPDTIISGKAVFKRPFCDDFLQFCFERFHVGLWSSRTKKNLDSVVEFLMEKFKGNLLFCWDKSHCTDTGYNTVENKDKPLVLKELKKIWEKHQPDLPWERGTYNESNTLLLDDSPYKALRNPPHTAIFPYTYSYKDVMDISLGPGGDLRVYLEGLASADNVQSYVELNPFGQRPITKTNSSWNFYLKVIGTTSSQWEEDADNSSAYRQRLAPNGQGMGFDDRVPANAQHDRGIGFDGRCPLPSNVPGDLGIDFGGRNSVAAMPRPPNMTVPLPPDASNTLYVEGLPPDSTTREVSHIFRPFEGYKEVRLVWKKSRHYRGDTFVLGFVEFVNPACAAAAMSALEGYQVDERVPNSARLRLQFSRSLRTGSESHGKRQCRYYDC